MNSTTLNSRLGPCASVRLRVRVMLFAGLAGIAVLCAHSPLRAQALPAGLDLATDPLLGTRPLHPNVALALSVEFPTVGAAFNQITYTAGTRYVGYFEPATCYTYDSANAWFVPAGASNANFSCNGSQFSGNFMNWATMSSIDIFRYAMTGGHRVVDTTGQTVLSRAYLPSGESTSSGMSQPSNFFAHNSYFPRRWVSTTESGNNGNIAQVAPSSVTPFSPNRISVVNCRDEVLFGAYTSGSNNCASPGTNARFASDSSSTVRRYKVRVKVCDATEGPARGELCGSYPNGGNLIYKPIGQIQKNADHMRFSAFGYLMDQSTARYGGVLRAPMKYAGPNTYDASFRLLGSNSAQEWDAQTGIFVTNPDGASEGHSGVVSYLNQFGGLSGYEGVYKQYDPVGELYYEAVRYLQGKDPTAAATTNLSSNPKWKQGFPVVTQWSSQDPLMCPTQPQYIIAIADTNAWADKTIPGNTATSVSDTARAIESDDGMDVRHWTQAVGLQALADAVLPLTGGAINTATAQNLQNWEGGGRGNNFYMAGLAYWAKTQDIRADNALKPMSIGAQHITTMTIDVAEPSSLQPQERQLFLAGAYGSDDPVNTPNWSMADSPQRLIDALESSFARVSATSGSLGGGTISSGIFEPGETGVFVPQFSTQGWSGELKYFLLTQVLDGSGVPTGEVAFSSLPAWHASKGIAPFNETTLTDGRNIWLGRPLGGGVPFQWAQLTSAEQVQLDTNPRTLQQDGNGQARLYYLRGSRMDEGIDPANFVGELPEGADGTATGAARPFRVRNAQTTLGDIVNSAPVYVGKPAARISDALVPGDSYRAWSRASARVNRQPMVYVGTNAGMVHGFNADTGAEVLAYVPSVLVPKLAKLTHPGYKHEPFVDGPLAASEAYAKNAWRTVLTGGYGGGARGVYALDVTDPTAFAADNVLWEFSASDDADMGYVTGRPLIVPMQITQGSSVQTQWFVVTASGMNSYGDGAAGDTAHGYLFFLSLDKPAGVSWQLGSNYYKVQIPLDSTSMAPNGLAQPGGVYDRLGVLRRLYVGDLRGNLWRVDTLLSDPAQWSVAYASTPLFSARDVNGLSQPITTPPVIAYGPGNGYMVLFGTGQLLAKEDNIGRAPAAGVTPFDGQTFYAVWDDLQQTVSGRAKLAERIATVPSGAASASVTGSSFQFGNGASQRRGWYVDLPSGASDGERVVSPAVLGLGNVYFNSIMPGADPCDDGLSRSYRINVLSGLGFVQASGVGYLATPLLLRTGRHGLGQDPTGFGGEQIDSALVNLGTQGQEIQSQPMETLSSGAWTWRELLNWRELRR